MAAVNSLLSEDRFLCSVCLDVFTEPVSTPCGHNFCSACIHNYWDSTDTCQCPLCKRTFSTRPELQVNTIMSELSREFKKSVQVKTSIPDAQLPAGVYCDFCSEVKEKAVKSCLVCLMSLCEVHLEPHQRVTALKSHTLLDPVKNLEDRMCKIHNKITELYCRSDQAFICVSCSKTDHKSHEIVLLEDEYETAIGKKDNEVQKMQQRRQLWSEKIAQIEKSLDVMQRETEREKDATMQVFTDLISFIQRSQVELIDAIDERHREAKQKAEGILKELRLELTELESRSSELEQLSQSEDHYHFLQSSLTLCSPLNRDFANTNVSCDMSFEAVRRDVTLLKQRVDEIMKDVPEIKMKTMKKMRAHAVDLTLDPDTANYSLDISEDGKQVVNKGIKQQRPKNPKRFETCSEVLTKEGFTTGRFYFEVQVKGMTCWRVGVVRESVDRKGFVAVSVKNGFWALQLNLGKYTTSETNTAITLKGQFEKLGIFVDYNKRVVSFYDVDLKSHIRSITDCKFTEKLYPYFCIESYENGKNSALLIITPVSHTD